MIVGFWKTCVSYYLGMSAYHRPDKFIVVFSHYQFIAAFKWLDSIK